MHIQFNYPERYAYKRIIGDNYHWRQFWWGLDRDVLEVSSREGHREVYTITGQGTGLWILLLYRRGQSGQERCAWKHRIYHSEGSLCFPLWASQRESVRCRGPQQEKCVFWQHKPFRNWGQGLMFLDHCITSNQNPAAAETWSVHTIMKSVYCLKEQDGWLNQEAVTVLHT